MTDEPFEVCITIAAMRLHRCKRTLRRWGQRGEVAGVRLDVFRHPTTGVRYFRRSQVEAVHAALNGSARATMSSGVQRGRPNRLVLVR